jgi:hypothetical protein
VTIQQQMHECLRQQAGLWSWHEREDAIQSLADALTEHWAPEGLTDEDMGVIDPMLIRAMALAIGHGLPIGGYEVKIHELFQRLEAPAPLPEVREPGYNGHLSAGRRAGPRRRVQ